MRSIDLSPLYRSFIGVDRMANMLDSLESADTGSFPPYDIEVVGEHKYRITLAVAGFARDELTIEQAENRLTVSGVRAMSSKDTSYLYQGIARRNFERRFQLADHVKVVRADYHDGLLHIDLVREVPEAMKPRQISIGEGDQAYLDQAPEENSNVA